MAIIHIALIAFFATTPKLTVHFFYSPGCGHCMDILLEDIPKLESKYRFVFKPHNIDIVENYQLLEKMEETVANKSDDLPVVFVGDSVFYGPETIRKKLEPTLRISTVREDTIPPDTATLVADTLVFKTGSINLYYFTQLKCPECNRMNVLLKALQTRYPAITVYRYDIFDDSSKLLYERLAQLLKVPETKRLLVPAIFIGQDYLIKDLSAQALESLIQKYRTGSPRLDTLKITEAGTSIIERFSRFSVVGILIAGFLDGINPCAFATIVFFISYLVFIGRQRRDVIAMSGSFISAIFIAYFAIGIGAYNLLRNLVGITVIARIIFLGFGILSLVLGGLSIHDFLMSRKGDYSKMLLQLPMRVKQQIHARIREGTRMRGIIVGSFIVGLLVSFLEFGCTGQVYLPTITFMISRAGVGLKPYSALILYNIAFILPLIAIALAASLFAAQNIARLMEKRIPIIKLLTALLFFTLGIFLLWSI